MAKATLAKASECPICLTDFKDPRVLPTCGHSICAGCVQRLIDASPSRTTVACPECREPSIVPKNGFPKNFRLSEVLLALQAGPGRTSSRAEEDQQVRSSSNAAPIRQRWRIIRFYVPRPNAAVAGLAADQPGTSSTSNPQQHAIDAQARRPLRKRNATVNPAVRCVKCKLYAEKSCPCRKEAPDGQYCNNECGCSDELCANRE